MKSFSTAGCRHFHIEDPGMLVADVLERHVTCAAFSGQHPSAGPVGGKIIQINQQ